MRYTVVWTLAAQQDLAAVWLAESDRDAIASAAGMIDRLLARDPEAIGEARFDTVRTVAIPPLGVDYEVIVADRLVYVLSAWKAAIADS